MGGSVSIVNNTTCALSISMQILLPYYYEVMVLPGESMERSDVGNVWFDIVAFPWHGGFNQDFGVNTKPKVLMNSDGDLFTLLEGIGIRGALDSDMIGKGYNEVNWDDANPLQKAVIGNGGSASIDRGSGRCHYYETIHYYRSPFILRSNGWYVTNENIWEIQGGPHCEMRNEFYVKNGVGRNKTIQLIDETQGLGGFSIVKIK